MKTYLFKISLSLWLFLFCYSVNAQQNKSISAAAFGALPEVYRVKISPDGDRILLLENRGGKMALITRLISDPARQEHLIPLEKGDYNWAEWATNDRLIVSYRYVGQEDRGRSRELKLQRRLLSMNWDGTDAINPIKFKISAFARFKPRVPVVQDHIIDMLSDDPDHILIQMDIDEANEEEVYKVNIKTRKRTRILKSRKSIDWWMTDQDHVVRYGEGKVTVFGLNKVRHVGQYRKSEDSKWFNLFSYNELVDRRPFYFEGFSDDPSVIYITMDDENKRRGLFTYNVDTKKVVEKIAGSDDYDIYDVSFNEQKELEHFAYYDEKPFYVRFDKYGKELDARFEERFPNSTVIIQSKSKDKQKVIINVTSDKEYGSYYLLDVVTDDYTLIGENYNKLDKSKLSAMEPVRYLARDGLEISGYLSLPASGPSRNLPTIIMPHGGPMSSDGWGFDYWTQFLTTRGYAVLQMNYRGSTGYGEDFRMMGYHEWGGKMLEDINDGTKWMIEQGIANPNRVCIMGGSYGGYAALQSVVKDQSLYKCSVAYAPVTNLTGFMKEMRKIDNYKSYENYVTSDDWSFKEASPINNINKLNLPILLIHGNKDLTSPVRQSRTFVSGMDKAGKNIEYIEMEGGDHFLSNQIHRIEFLKSIEVFLENNL